jgi:hypothetical protein
VYVRSQAVAVEEVDGANKVMEESATKSKRRLPRWRS